MKCTRAVPSPGCWDTPASTHAPTSPSGGEQSACVLVADVSKNSAEGPKPGSGWSSVVFLATPEVEVTLAPVENAIVPARWHQTGQRQREDKREGCERQILSPPSLEATHLAQEL